MKCLLLFIAVLPAVLARHLPFTLTLREDAYTLSWDFDLEQKTVVFQVNVSTTGWVGLGISPDGGMPNSDVIIGWVDDSGTAFLNDRFATGESRPVIDAQQDWFLISGQQGDGYTVLMFSRNWTTCDEQDREILPQTQRLIFSWSDSDPVNNDPTQVSYHGRNNRGSASVNLLGGLPDPPPEPEDSQSFFLGVENILIPNDTDTTYWCVTLELPEEILSGTHYIYKYSPEIQANNTAFVHHIIISQCAELVDVTAGSSASCFGDVASISPLEECMSSASLAGWAVGGGDFTYPPDVAYRLSGPGKGRFVVMEMHYDNPELVSGVFDNSGIRLFYTARKPENEAGQFLIGAATDQSVIIPPQAENFTVVARCPIGCTNQNIPETGIKIFANLFHTHLAGHGLVLEHYRVNPDCGVLEQLEPIDINLQYDFNFQQTNILPQEVTVLPGDILVLKCFYQTMDRDFITLGGEGTRDEMCFAFPLFYPLFSPFACGSGPVEMAYDSFIDNNVPQNLQDELRNVTRRIYGTTTPDGNLDESTRPSREEVKEIFGRIDWTHEMTENLESSLLDHAVYSTCIGRDFVFEINTTVPEATCYYEPPNVCTGETPKPCCERLGAVKFAVNTFLVVAIVGLTTLFM